MERIDRPESGDPNGRPAAFPLMRSKVRAYSHQGHGPRADQQAGYNISDFRQHPSHLRTAAGPYKRVATSWSHSPSCVQVALSNAAPNG
jgi:hypothetical protein